ncbi:alpha/beta hydrolase family protein [Streptomyces aureocirculatus]|uniref:alpha/beta hydrolase family protein n=1 Tax=Streptomyces aureocirculatus TaxID=67275 RepID=UPI000AC1FC09|nr:chlorophyllase [Streptomyces aureocirculatus]
MSTHTHTPTHTHSGATSETTGETTGADSAFGSPAPVLSVTPVVLPVPGRAVDLEVRVSAPTTGGDLPVILLSHGQGHSGHLSSLYGYAPLVDFWAARGFAVIQPTHLSSSTLSLPADTPGAPLYWRSRAQDMRHIIDRLDAIEDAVPQLRGRLDHGSIAVAGHSMGGHTASLLLGARLTDPDDGTEVDLTEPRITAGVLLAAPGRGGGALSEFAARSFGFMGAPDFSAMTTPTLVVAGDKDESAHLTVMGADWHADPYTLAPGPKALLTLFGGEHGLGGVSGYDVAETTDENPARVAAVQRLTWAYLRSALHSSDGGGDGGKAWQAACAALAADPEPQGRVEVK